MRKMGWPDAYLQQPYGGSWPLATSQCSSWGVCRSLLMVNNVKPTRRCLGCGAVKDREDMPLFQRQYTCACGFTLARDGNACRNMVRYAFEGAWWPDESEKRPGTGLETSPEKALALAQVG